MKLLNTHTDIEEIIIYLQDASGEVMLSDKLQEKLTRLTRCADLIKQYGSRMKVVPMLCNMEWEKKGGEKYKISQQTAYRDFEDTQEIFGSTIKSSRDFWVDMLIGMVMETRSKALVKKDFKTAASCEKNMKEIIAEFFGSADKIPYHEIQPVNIQIGFFPELSKVKIPENWEQQVKQLIKMKKHRSENISDAEIIPGDD